jgi:hypothetical protein
MRADSQPEPAPNHQSFLVVRAMLQLHQSAVAVCCQPKLDLVDLPAWIAPSQEQPMGGFAPQDVRGHLALRPDVERQVAPSRMSPLTSANHRRS